MPKVKIQLRHLKYVIFKQYEHRAVKKSKSVARSARYNPVYPVTGKIIKWPGAFLKRTLKL